MTRKIPRQRIGKTPDGSTYHLMVHDDRKSVQTLSGQNLHPLCESVSPVKMIVLDGSKAGISELDFCQRCQTEIQKWMRICKMLRASGEDPARNLYQDPRFSPYGESLSLTGLDTHRRRYLISKVRGT